MNKTLRISLFGLAGAVAGFTLQGCFSPQPTPECSVTITAAALGLHPYYVKLDKVDATGTCGDIDHMYAGLQRFRTQAQGGAFNLAVRTSLVADPALGYTYAEDVDPYNNCAAEENCDGSDDPTGACVGQVADGGYELLDGTPVTVAAGVGTVDLPDGGSYEVDATNECASVPEPIARVDAADPKGKNITHIGSMPQFPTNNFCSISDWKGGVQNFGQEDLTLVDGSPLTLPAVTYKVEFTDFNVVNSTKVPGTAFVANMKYTEGSCTANFKALGFWPEVPCSNPPSEGALVTSTECDPNSDLDAGRVFGSGINPAFQPKCDTARGVCVPTVDVTTIK